MKTYDRREFALAYLRANTQLRGFDIELVGYPEALHEYSTALLDGLERLFGITLRQDAMPAGMGPVFMIFESVARSYLAITGPMDDYLEASLIHTRLQQAGIHDAFVAGIGRITELNRKSRAVHLDTLTTLLGALLGDNADRVVGEDELHALGVSTVPPNRSDYDY